MKNISLIIVFFFITACSSGFFDKTSLITVKCPPILFSSDHKTYFELFIKNTSIENIKYKANINNARFSSPCMFNEDKEFFTTNLSILFIVQPILQEQFDVKLPFYVAIIDQNKNILEIDYFLANSELKKNFEIDRFVETEVTKTIKLTHSLKSESITVVIGFMIDKKKTNSLN